ncbi:MAG: hypothetical protein ACLQVA_05950 [Candidatus Brocadiia bacterium]
MGARAINPAKTHEAASPREISRELDRVAPGAPLLALGQTPLWDEPMKAVVASAFARPMIVGIHDLDYFSRVRSPLSRAAWQIVPRNDGTTRDAWIAAGEISALFGAEVWPTRQALAEAGVRLDRLLPEGHARQAMLDRITEAFGWRGIVGNGPDSVVCDTPAREVEPALLELLEWASRGTQAVLVRPQDRKSVRATIACIAEAVKQFIAERPAGSVGELYTRMLRGFYEGFLPRSEPQSGTESALPPNVTIAGARELLAFNRRTADLPRFQFAAHFLNEAESAACRAAYDVAAGESATARLAASGEGALPFDVYAPGRGRGTLRVGPAFVAVDFRQPVQWPLAEPVRDVRKLAEILEDALGGEVALLGKALVLPAMLSAEFVMVFAETGSAYLPRTQQMLAAMGEGGVRVRAHPILRMRLRTWDSLSVCGAALRLPEHLAQAFGKPALDCREFGRRWRSAVKEQQRLLRELKGVAGACDLVRYLADDQHAGWFRRLRQCAAANALLLKIQRQADALRHKAQDLRAREDSAVAEIRMLETRRGAMSRERIRPLKWKLADLPAHAPAGERARLGAEYAEAQREGGALLLSLEAKQKELSRLREKRGEIAARLLALERGRRAASARRLLLSVERAAEKARLQLVRNALLASEGLPHADLRPSAWWFPALDPTGRWFQRVRRTATFRLEPLVNGGDDGR